METAKTADEYRTYLKQVKRTGKSLLIKNEMSDKEKDKITDDDLKGLDVIVRKDNCDEIKPL